MKKKQLPIYLAAMTACAVSFSSCVMPSQNKEKGHAKAHWSYKGKTGPSHWGDLDPSYSLCKTGKSQSPINIKSPTIASVQTPVYHYQSSALNVLNNGHTIQQNVDPGSYVTLGKKRYDLLQFHFHSKSEHTVKGMHYPMEMHLVHKSSDGELLVVGFFIKKGANNSALASVFNNMPKAKGGTTVNKKTKLNLAKIVGNKNKFYTYSGSLTTPPGTEGVKWFVNTQPISASSAQIAKYTSLYNYNYRPIQPLNGRTVKVSR